MFCNKKQFSHENWLRNISYLSIQPPFNEQKAQHKYYKHLSELQVLLSNSVNPDQQLSLVGKRNHNTSKQQQFDCTHYSYVILLHCNNDKIWVVQLNKRTSFRVQWNILYVIIGPSLVKIFICCHLCVHNNLQ